MGLWMRHRCKNASKTGTPRGGLQLCAGDIFFLFFCAIPKSISGLATKSKIFSLEFWEETIFQGVCELCMHVPSLRRPGLPQQGGWNLQCHTPIGMVRGSPLHSLRNQDRELRGEWGQKPHFLCLRPGQGLLEEALPALYSIEKRAKEFWPRFCNESLFLEDSGLSPILKSGAQGTFLKLFSIFLKKAQASFGSRSARAFEYLDMASFLSNFKGLCLLSPPPFSSFLDCFTYIMHEPQGLS